MVNQSYDAEAIALIADRAEQCVEFIRGKLFAPDDVKKPPVFNQSQMTQLCGLEKIAVVRAVAKLEAMEVPTLSPGKVVGPNRREFTLENVQDWARHYGCSYKRQEGQDAAVIAVGISKGGVGKSTTTANLAQGLSLKGYKVLVIDFDPQGSLTGMMGLSPIEIAQEQTFLPIARGDKVDFNSLIQKTYWSNVDILPGAIGLNAADFYLPARQVRDGGFRFYAVLANALRQSGALKNYDYVVIDTPPSMSYLTINAYWAADGILTPLPPEGPDFASSVQFWSLLSELTGQIAGLAKQDGLVKQYSWLRVFASKVDHLKPQSEAILEWMKKAYGPEMMSVEVPTSSAVSVSHASFSTLYDITKYVGSAKTYSRVREAYDKLINQVDHLTRMYKWKEVK